MKRLTREQTLRIKTLYEVEGKTYAEIGEALGGYKAGTIEKAVKRLRLAGIEVITHKGPRAVKLN